VVSEILHVNHPHLDTVSRLVKNQLQKLRPDPEFQPPTSTIGAVEGLFSERDPVPVNHRPPAVQFAPHEVHTGAADEIAHKCVGGAFKEDLGGVHRHDLALVHHHHLVGKGQGLHLVVGDIDQGEFSPLMDLSELTAQ